MIGMEAPLLPARILLTGFNRLLPVDCFGNAVARTKEHAAQYLGVDELILNHQNMGLKRLAGARFKR
jgi:hypothetical protein